MPVAVQQGNSVDSDKLSKEYELKEIVDILSKRLELIVTKANVHEPYSKINLNHPCFFFQSVLIPSLSVNEYFQRINHYVLLKMKNLYEMNKIKDSKPALVGILIATMIYIDRYANSIKDISALTAFTIHRILAASFVLACKAHSEIPIKNSYVARVAGTTLKELNILEVEFLSCLNANLYISEQEYNDYASKLYASLQAVKECKIDFTKVDELKDEKSKCCRLM